MRIHVSVSVHMCEGAGDLPQVSFTSISIYFIFLKQFLTLSETCKLGQAG